MTYLCTCWSVKIFSLLYSWLSSKHTKKSHRDLAIVWKGMEVALDFPDLQLHLCASPADIYKPTVNCILYVNLFRIRILAPTKPTFFGNVFNRSQWNLL